MPVPSEKRGSKPPALRPAHAVGGSTAAILGAVAVGVANHFGYTLSDPDALVLGSAVLGAGLGLGHVIGEVGIVGAVKQLWRGRR